jgi:hypothetical protein
MTSFTKMKVFSVGVGVGVLVGFRFHVHAQDKHFQGTGVVVGCGVSWWEMLNFVAGGIVSHDVYSWDQINLQKITHQIDRICSARVNCAVASARSLCV